MTAPPTAQPMVVGSPQRAFTIQVADDDPTKQPAKILYLGRPKSGKTELLTSWNAATDTEGEPGLFVIAFDKNLGTLMAARPKVPFVAVDSRDQLTSQVLPWIISGGLAKEYPSVTTVGFDSISFYVNQLVVEMSQGGKEMDWQLFASRVAQDMGQFTRLANPIAGLPKQYHWVATCHEQDRYTTRRTSGGQRERHLEGIEPAIPGKTAGIITGYFDLVLCPEREVKAVQTVAGGPFEQQSHYNCRAMERPDHKAPAGGKIWGKSITGATVNGTYLGLKEYCTAADVAAEVNK